MHQTVALAWLQRTCESSWSYLAVHSLKVSLNGSTRPGRRHKVVPCIAAAFLDWKGFKICILTSNDKHVSYLYMQLHAYWIYFTIASMWLLVFIICCNYIVYRKIHFYCLYIMVVYIFIIIHIYHVYVEKEYKHGSLHAAYTHTLHELDLTRVYRKLKDD